MWVHAQANTFKCFLKHHIHKYTPSDKAKKNKKKTTQREGGRDRNRDRHPNTHLCKNVATHNNIQIHADISTNIHTTHNHTYT